MDDHYRTLGVSKNASADELKKNYRKQAVEHHPDKGGDPEVFKKINEAYHVLSDPGKRQEYDMQGMQGMHRFPPNDFFAQGFMGSFFHSGMQPSHRPKKCIHKSITLTLCEAYTGCKRVLEIDTTIECECAVQCTTCNGKGKVTGTILQHVGPNRIIRSVTEECSTCKGKGKTYRTASCSVCKNERRIHKPFKITVDIPPRTFNNIRSTLKHPNESNTDIVISASITYSAGFDREKDNLVFNKEISLEDALLGSVFLIPHPSGEELVLDYTKKSDILQPGSIVSIKGKGVLPNTDLLVKFHVKFPSKRNVESSMQDTFSSLRENFKSILHIEKNI